MNNHIERATLVVTRKIHCGTGDRRGSLHEGRAAQGTAHQVGNRTTVADRGGKRHITPRAKAGIRTENDIGRTTDRPRNQRKVGDQCSVA